jgi:hypothetical protein
MDLPFQPPSKPPSWRGTACGGDKEGRRGTAGTELVAVRAAGLEVTRRRKAKRSLDGGREIEAARGETAGRGTLWEEQGREERRDWIRMTILPLRRVS